MLTPVVFGTTLGAIYLLFGRPALLGALLNGLVFGLPWLVVLSLLVGRFAQRRWRYLGYLLLLFVLVTLAYAALALQSDLSHLEPAEHYSWNDWYAVFLPGAYFSGVLLLAMVLLGRLIRLLRWGFRRLRGRRIVITGTVESPG